MGQLLRQWEYRDGRREPAPSDLFYFNSVELEEGEALRQRELGKILGNLDLDFIAFQEVAAGLPGEEKSCAVFSLTERGDGSQAFGVNSVLRLAAQPRFSNYSAALACRGNTGWRTSDGIFSQRRVLTKPKAGSAASPRVVWDFDENPYPAGILVEGMAILHRRDWRLVTGEMRQLSVGPYHESFGYQVAAFERILSGGEAQRVIVANIHGGHKVRNFEQAAAVRMDLLDVLDGLGWPLVAPQVILGDINESLVRVRAQGGATTGRKVPRWFASPWEFARPGVFDLTLESSGEQRVQPRFPVDLVAQIDADNLDAGYKPWAQVPDARGRAGHALELLRRFQDRLARAGGSGVLKEAVYEVELQQPGPSLHVGFERIDHIFVPAVSVVTGGKVLGEDISWSTLDFVSDHPLVWAEVQIFSADPSGR
jgi:endonuclease/exonuclease/phosphatase family metal-dependent hydrolase